MAKAPPRKKGKRKGTTPRKPTSKKTPPSSAKRKPKLSKPKAPKPTRDAAGRFKGKGKRKAPPPAKRKRKRKPEKPSYRVERIARVPEVSRIIATAEADLEPELDQLGASVVDTVPQLIDSPRGEWVSFEHNLSDVVPLEDAPGVVEMLRDAYAHFSDCATTIGLMVVDVNARMGIEETVYRQVSNTTTYDGAFQQVEFKIESWATKFTSRNWAGFIGIHLQFLVTEKVKVD